MFHEKLKALRIRKGLTQSQMAEILNTAQTTYSGWERSKEPNYKKLKEIANFFNVSIDFLLDNEKFIKEDEIQKIIRELTEEEKQRLTTICIGAFPKAYKKSTH